VVNVGRLLDDSDLLERMSRGPNPYGDGRAAGRIVTTILKILGVQS
jgi:UDP-N-acetylglucosamine 2-epimerase